MKSHVKHSSTGSLYIITHFYDHFRRKNYIDCNTNISRLLYMPVYALIILLSIAGAHNIHIKYTIPSSDPQKDSKINRPGG